MVELGAGTDCRFQDDSFHGGRVEKFLGFGGVG